MSRALTWGLLNGYYSGERKKQSEPSVLEAEVKRSVEVTIDGKPIALKSDYEQAYLDDLARFVEERYREVRLGRGGNPYSQAVLAALNIADELFKEKARNQKLQDGVRRRCERIQDLIDEIDPVGAGRR